MTTLETLKAARAKIAKRGNWVKGYFARNHMGCTVRPTASNACRWCALGAIRAVNGNAYDIEELLADYAEGAVDVFNDTHTHAEVLALFDKAIAEAK